MEFKGTKGKYKMAETKSTGRGRPKKVETTETEVQAQMQNVEAENDALKKELADIKAQMQLLMSSMTAPSVSTPTKKNERLIRIVNMTNGMAVLRGSTIWKIDGQFNYQDFLETEASIIVANLIIIFSYWYFLNKQNAYSNNINHYIELGQERFYLIQEWELDLQKLSKYKNLERTSEPLVEEQLCTTEVCTS